MGIVDVTKLMKSIPVATSGEVVEILVADGALAMHKRSASSFHCEEGSRKALNHAAGTGTVISSARWP